MKAVQAERRKLGLQESEEKVCRGLLTRFYNSSLVCVQVALTSTGHYDMDVYSSSDKSGFYDSIPMAEDEEVSSN